MQMFTNCETILPELVRDSVCEDESDNRFYLDFRFSQIQKTRTRQLNGSAPLSLTGPIKSSLSNNDFTTIAYRQRAILEEHP